MFDYARNEVEWPKVVFLTILTNDVTNDVTDV